MAQGTVKDNVRDELDEVAVRGRRDREERKEATTEEVGSLVPEGAQSDGR
jgi:hypothetical protein